MRKLVTLKSIDKILPIENADAIEVAQIGGWKVVVKKGEFYEGQKVFYFEIDSMIPLDRGYFEFLRSRGVKVQNGKEYHRLKTVKLRGQISQGLILPYSIFEINPKAKIDEKEIPLSIDIEGNKCSPYLDPDETCEKGLTIHEEKGGDYSEYFGVVKYEVPEQWVGRKPWPMGIEKTDEERLQNLPNLLESLNPDEWYATEKVDGTSLTMFVKRENGEFIRGVCSRNYELEEDKLYWPAAINSGFFTIMEEYLKDKEAEDMTIILQGELVGPGIQKNPLGLKEQELLLYTIQVNGERLDRLTIWSDPILHELSSPEHWVPIRSEVKLIKDLDEMIAMPDGMKTQVIKANKDAQIEGLVWRRNSQKQIEYEGEFIHPSFKCISSKYLLKHEG